MPYYTGSVNSFADLRTAIFTACTTEGWTLTGEILTKGTAAVKIENNTVNSSDKDIGLVLQGGTSMSAGSLVNPSLITPRMGRTQRDANPIAFPITYYIFIFNDPDEVYVIANYNISYYMWLTFGISSVPNLGSTGLWLSASANAAQGPTGTSYGNSYSITGGPGASNQSTGFFMETAQGGVGLSQLCQNTIATNLDGKLWSGEESAQYGKFTVCAMQAAGTLLNVLPNAWNSECPLVRVQAYQWRDSNKCSLVADIKNARYVRVDNYEPLQILQLGSDRWMVFPFVNKNTALRNGASLISHSGTFGWAIRYDGP